MKIIESSIIGKKSPEACEDGMVVTDNFIAVIDGSTSKTPKHLNPDMKNGRYAMMLISEYIREELKADASVDDFCQGVTAYIYNKVYEKLGVEERLKEHPEERLTASINNGSICFLASAGERPCSISSTLFLAISCS